MLFTLGNTDMTNKLNLESHVLEATRNNIQIVTRNEDWIILCFLVTLFNKRMSINIGIVICHTAVM